MVINSNSIRKLLIFHIFFVMFFLLVNQLGLPWSVVYILDIFVVLEMIWSYKKIIRVFKEAEFSYMIVYLFVFVGFLLLTQVINFVPIKLGIMAYRRTFRFVLFYIACACLLTVKDVEKILSWFVKLQLINVILTVYQLSTFRGSMDYVGGIFGLVAGANGYTNIYLCIICIYSIVCYLQRNGRLSSTLLVIGSSFLIATLIELKVFFFEIIIIVVLAVILSKPSKRAIRILLISIVVFAVALTVFAKIFPEHMAVLVDKNLFLEYTIGKTQGYNISRLNAFSEINRLFFENNVLDNLIGYGFGNCEAGSAFYKEFGGYHYTWFTHQVTFLETGYVGFILYVWFFVLCFRHATKLKRKHTDKGYFYTIVQLLSIMCIVFVIYNQILRIEGAYLIYFVLAISVIASKKNVEIGEKCEDRE